MKFWVVYLQVGFIWPKVDLQCVNTYSSQAPLTIISEKEQLCFSVRRGVDWSDIHKLDICIHLIQDKINMHLCPLIFSHSNFQTLWPISIIFDLLQRYFFKNPRNFTEIEKWSQVYLSSHKFSADTFWSLWLNISLNAAIKILSARAVVREDSVIGTYWLSRKS